MKSFAFCLVLALSAFAQSPIRQHPKNSHYFLYNNKPTVLITAGEHYGAVLNKNFDYTRYLDELRRYGLNLTRTFSGSYREDGVNPHGNSPLTPDRGPQNYIAPWAWSDADGGYDGKKFDLDKWNPLYFERLRAFIKAAKDRGVVVELVLFCLMYSDDHHWKVSPLHPDNNLQGESWRGLPPRRFLTLDKPGLVERQKAFARKIVTELKGLPNVYIEIANEPAPANVDSPLAKDNFAWHEAIISEIVASGNRHLLAYNDHYNAGRGIGPIPKQDAISILNIHYLPKLAEALDVYANNKILSLDETRWISQPLYPRYNNTMKPTSGRLEAWEFLVGGGAVYNGLNYAFQTDNPTGNAPESNEFKGYLQKLKQFVDSFKFVNMHQDTSVISGELPAGTFARSISELGKQYAIYIHHGTYGNGRGRYECEEKPRTLDLELTLPAGSYRAEWLLPAQLQIMKTQRIRKHSGGPLRLAVSPEYQIDIALRILKD